MKRCSRCGLTKPLDQFSRDRTKVGGYRSHCRACHNSAKMARYHGSHAIRGRKIAYSRDAYLAWRARYPDGPWKAWLKKAHDLVPEQWFAMWHDQGGLCYLCEQPLPDDRSKVCVDHDHSHCGQSRSCAYCRRGLTHDYCNRILGILHEDVAVMRQVLAPAFVANFERTQAQAESLMAAAPEQGVLLELPEITAS